MGNIKITAANIEHKTASTLPHLSLTNSDAACAFEPLVASRKTLIAIFFHPKMRTSLVLSFLLLAWFNVYSQTKQDHIRIQYVGASERAVPGLVISKDSLENEVGFFAHYCVLTDEQYSLIEKFIEERNTRKAYQRIIYPYGSFRITQVQDTSIALDYVLESVHVYNPEYITVYYEVSKQFINDFILLSHFNNIDRNLGYYLEELEMILIYNMPKYPIKKRRRFLDIFKI